MLDSSGSSALISSAARQYAAQESVARTWKTLAVVLVKAVISKVCISVHDCIVDVWPTSVDGVPEVVPTRASDGGRDVWNQDDVHNRRAECACADFRSAERIHEDNCCPRIVVFEGEESRPDAFVESLLPRNGKRLPGRIELFGGFHAICAPERLSAFALSIARCVAALKPALWFTSI